MEFRKVQGTTLRAIFGLASLVVVTVLAGIDGETEVAQPDKPFHNFRALKSVDPLILCSSETSCDGF